MPKAGAASASGARAVAIDLGPRVATQFEELAHVERLRWLAAHSGGRVEADTQVLL
jgi:hypothetical protein